MKRTFGTLLFLFATLILNVTAVDYTTAVYCWSGSNLHRPGFIPTPVLCNQTGYACMLTYNRWGREYLGSCVLQTACTAEFDATQIALGNFDYVKCCNTTLCNTAKNGYPWPDPKELNSGTTNLLPLSWLLVITAFGLNKLL